MATSKYNQFDGIRGKLGQFVGSRNAAGNILRKLSKPTNPKTGAQQTARNAMRYAGKGFATLSQALQGGWLTFAQNLFNPLKKKHTGNTTGAQAYTGVAATIFNAGSHVDLTTFEMYGAGTPISGVTFNLMTMDATPPISSVSPNIVDTADSAAGFKLRNIYFSPTFIITADIDLLGYQGAGITQGHFIDNKGNNYGFGFYLSDALNFIGQRPKNQYHSFMGFSGLPVKSAGVITGAHGFRILSDASGNIAGHKNSPTLGQIFLMSVVLIANNGTVTKVDSGYVTFGTIAPAIPS